MTPLWVGAAATGAGLVLVAVAVWWWLAGAGRHRRGRFHAAPVLPVPPGVLVGPHDADTITLRLGAVDRADFAHCPVEGVRSPHFFHDDGRRTCCRCQTTSAGDQP